MSSPAESPSTPSFEAQADEAVWIRLSLLEHYAYCPHQARLLWDGVWADNHLTVSGNIGHERVDTAGAGWQRGVKVHRRVELASEGLRIYGIADVVEERSDGTLSPVEHKHGRGAGNLWPATVQVVAQSLCLEAMTGRRVAEAFIYITTERTRVPVEIAPYRSRVIGTLADLRSDLDSTPSPAMYEARKCRNCSIRGACQPQVENVRR